MTSALQRLPDETIELTITIPWTDIASNYEHAIVAAIQNAELPGFRKGKAPRKAVEEKLDKTKVYEEVLKDLLPKAYNEAVTQQKIHPIVTPKVELKEANEGKDWTVRALTCEKPQVTLGEYKKAIGDVKTSKQKKIWVPGQEPSASAKTLADKEDQKPTLDELLKALYEHVTIKIPGLLLEHEVNRLLSDLIDQTKKLGLSVDQYLASTNRSPESIKKEYAEQAKRTLALEFALEEVADKEGILISDDDIAAVIKTAKTDEEKKSLEGQKYYLASLLRRQKTLDFLAAL
ncbi:hypothetical protein HY948_04550 [Candidatus Gottesmanbacteria bacterium]|nr:hypothetical protein [Candidatus Gottesmanbacteria bacterium]